MGDDDLVDLVRLLQVNAPPGEHLAVSHDARLPALLLLKVLVNRALCIVAAER